jgi:hypothetical protein
VPIATALDEFRLLLGDRDTANQLFNDVEAQWFIDQQPGNVLLAVADACDALARQYAREFDFDANEDKSFKRSQKSAAYAAMAKDLRQRATAGGGLSAVVLTKVDAISDDLSSRDADVSQPVNGRTRHGYYDSDLPR